VARFFVPERKMNDLVAKAAIDRRIAEIITPVVEDMGFEVVRVRLMTGKESILQVMAQNLRLIRWRCPAPVLIVR